MGHRWPLSVEDGRAVVWTGEHRPELIDLLSLFRALVELPEEPPSVEDWRHVLPPGVIFVRPLGTWSVQLRTKQAMVPDFVVKIVPPQTGSMLRRWTEQLRHSRAQRAYLWGHRLRALGIDTPRPLGFLERGRRPGLGRSFVVTEYIYAQTLIEFRDKKLALETGDVVLEKRAMLWRVAELVRQLHAQDLVHGQLSAARILIDEASTWLVGLESLERAGRLGGTPRRDLRALAAELDRLGLGKRDALRFLSSYLRHHPDLRARRRRLFVELGRSSGGAAPKPERLIDGPTVASI